jgi:putative oxidoreductase
LGHPRTRKQCFCHGLLGLGVRSTIGPIVLTGKGPLCSRTSSTAKSERPSPVSSIPSAAYLIRARIAFIITSQAWSVPENRFRNRPLFGGCDLSYFRPQRLPELHSASPAGGIAGQFRGALYASHYLWVNFAFQVIAAVLLLVNRYVPLAVTLLAPVIVNILTFHGLMAPSGLPLALFVGELWAVIFVDVCAAFAGLFQSRSKVQA